MILFLPVIAVVNLPLVCLFRFLPVALNFGFNFVSLNSRSGGFWLRSSIKWDVLKYCWLPLCLVCRYIRLYGRKFSREDHVLFIKLLYELVTIPKLEISMMQGFARLLINLLKWVEISADCANFVSESSWSLAQCCTFHVAEFSQVTSFICPVQCWWLKGSLVQMPFKGFRNGMKLEECQFSPIRKTNQLREPRIKAAFHLSRRWKLAHGSIMFISLSQEKSWQCHLCWRLPEGSLVLPGLPAVCAKLGAGMGVFPCAMCPCQCWILKCLVFCFLLGKRNCFPGTI